MGIVRNNVEEIRDIQGTLVSGTNTKTVGGASLLGSGDIPQYTPPINKGANSHLAADNKLSVKVDQATTYTQKTK